MTKELGGARKSSIVLSEEAINNIEYLRERVGTSIIGTHELALHLARFLVGHYSPGGEGVNVNGTVCIIPQLEPRPFELPILIAGQAETGTLATANQRVQS